MASNVVVGRSVSYVTSIALGTSAAPFPSVPFPLAVPAPPAPPPAFTGWGRITTNGVVNGNISWTGDHRISTFANGSLIVYLANTGGGNGNIVMKFDPASVIAWQRVFDTDPAYTTVDVYSIDRQAVDNIAASVIYTDALTAAHPFLCLLNNAAVMQWSKRFVPPGTNVMAGFFNSSAWDSGTIGFIYYYENDDSNEYLGVAAYSTLGVELWKKKITYAGEAGYYNPFQINANADGSAIALFTLEQGQVSGNASVGVISFNSAGAVNWARSITILPTGSTSYFNAVPDATGNVYVTFFDASVNKQILCKLSSVDGSTVWMKSIESTVPPNVTLGTALTIASTGTVILGVADNVNPPVYGIGVIGFNPASGATVFVLTASTPSPGNVNSVNNMSANATGNIDMLLMGTNSALLSYPADGTVPNCAAVLGSTFISSPSTFTIANIVYVNNPSVSNVGVADFTVVDDIRAVIAPVHPNTFDPRVNF